MDCEYKYQPEEWVSADIVRLVFYFFIIYFILFYFIYYLFILALF